MAKTIEAYLINQQIQNHRRTGQMVAEIVWLIEYFHIMTVFLYPICRTTKSNRPNINLPGSWTGHCLKHHWDVRRHQSMDFSDNRWIHPNYRQSNPSLFG